MPPLAQVAQKSNFLQTPAAGLLLLGLFAIAVTIGVIIWARRGRTRCGACGSRMSGHFCRNCGARRPQRAFPID